MYNDKLESMRNFQPAFIEGTSNVCTSTYKDHALTEMHKHAIHLFTKDQSPSIFQYMPIAEACAQSLMYARTKEAIKKKRYCLYDSMALQSLCAIEQCHGVDLGTGYRNNQSCATFLRFIAHEQKESALSKSRFCSLQADGTADISNSEVELHVFLALYFDPFSNDSKVHVRNVWHAKGLLIHGRGQWEM